MIPDSSAFASSSPSSASDAERFAAYVTHAPDAIFVANAEGKYLDANPAAMRLLGYSREEILASTVMDLLPHDYQDDGRRSFENLKASGHDKRELHLLHKDGYEVPVLLEAVSLPDGTYLGFCKDITERRLAQRKLEESRRFSKVLLDSIPAPIFFKNAAGVYLGANRAFFRTMGKDEKDIVGRTVFEIAEPELASVYHSKDQELLAKPGKQEYEAELTNGVGERRRVIFHKATFGQKGGQPEGIIGFMIDVTQLRQAQQDQDLYLRAIQNVRQPLVVTDSKGTIKVVNQAFLDLYGFDMSEVVGQNPRILNPGRAVYHNFGYSDTDYDELFGSLHSFVTNPSGGAWENVVINRKKDGTLVWVRLVVNAMPREDGHPEHFIALPIDITGNLERQNLSKLQLYQTLASLAALRDNETGNHMRRAGIFARLLARAEGKPEKFCEDIETFAPMHDIGKVGIHDAILLAERKLTPEEFGIMKTHTVLGHQIVKGVDDLEMAGEITLSHHERWDGSGYPHGLRGSAIPISARIVAIVDVYDALRSKRPYKPAWSHEDAARYILQNAGTHFDPTLTRHFSVLASRFAAVFQELED